MTLRHANGIEVDPDDYASEVWYCKDCNVFPDGTDILIEVDGVDLSHRRCGELLMAISTVAAAPLAIQEFCDAHDKDDPSDLDILVGCLDVLAERLSELEKVVLSHLHKLEADE